MLFNSHEFVFVFAPATFLILYALRYRLDGWVWALTGASLAFYMTWNVLYGVLWSRGLR